MDQLEVMIQNTAPMMREGVLKKIEGISRNYKIILNFHEERILLMNEKDELIDQEPLELPVTDQISKNKMKEMYGIITINPNADFFIYNGGKMFGTWAINLKDDSIPVKRYTDGQ